MRTNKSGPAVRFATTVAATFLFCSVACKAFPINGPNVKGKASSPYLSTGYLFVRSALAGHSSGSRAAATTRELSRKEQNIPVGVLGPPEPIRSLKIGESANAFRHLYEKRCGSDGFTTNFTIERVSYTPDCFVLRDFLSPIECDDIISKACASNMAAAETVTAGDSWSRRNCTVAWIPSSGGDGSSLVNSLVQSTANLFLNHHILSNPQAGVEDLQVLRYDIGGEFVLHHDGEPRVLTIIYYLNGVGGTWFPLARTSNNIEHDPCRYIDQEEMNNAFAKQRDAAVQNKEKALEIGRGFEPETHGLLVKASSKQNGSSSGENPHVAWINRGDALAFYNYLDDGSARLDWRALHTGLETQEEDGVKWIANHWFRV